jgi:hypothetical protein
VRIGPLTTAGFVVGAHVLLLDDHDAVIGLERNGRVQGRFGVVVHVVDWDFVRALSVGVASRSSDSEPAPSSRGAFPRFPAVNPSGSLERSDARFVVIAPG